MSRLQVSDKHTPASLPEICAPREELLGMYDQCAKKQFIYVQAPAGYGKTISTLLWLRKMAYPFAWLSLDQYDNSIALFYRGLCLSLLAAIPQEQAVAEFAGIPSFSTAPVENTMEFLSMLDWRDERYALVLDDFHLIGNEEILKSLPYVLRRLPTTVNVLLLSRAALPGVMTTLKENNKMSFIGSGELAFTVEEIRKHYASYGRFITKEYADHLYSYTDGWVIMLNAMLIGGGQNLLDEDGRQSFMDYFEQNIWRGFDDATKIFLMKTSVADSFTLALCESLTESGNCGETLDMLIRGNINLTRVGDEYRYHQLFLEFLRERLAESQMDLRSLLNKAAVYYLEAKEFLKAAAYALRCGNSEIDMRVVQNFFQSNTPTLDRYLELARVYDADKLSDELLAKAPILYMPNILFAFITGDVANTQRFLDLFYKALPMFAKLDHPIAAVAITRLILDYRVNLADLPAFMQSLHLAIEKKVPGQAAIVTMQMPFLHRSNRDYTELLDANVKETVRSLFSCLLADDCACFSQSVTAGLLMEQNKPGEALEAALAAYDAMSENTSHEVFFGVSIGLAEIYSLRAEDEAHRSVLCRIRERIQQNRAQYLLKNLTAYEERGKLRDADKAAAQSWLENYYVTDGAWGEFCKIYQNFTTARALIVLSMPDKAMLILERLRKLGVDMNRLLDACEADVLMAVVEWTLGKKKESQSRLMHTLARLHPHGFIRIVANEGRAMMPALSAIIKKLRKDPHADAGFMKYVKEVYFAAYEQSKRYKGLTYYNAHVQIGLSKQQQHVLELLAGGNSNAQIVEMTGLKLNTIRTHTKLAYEKLGVNNVMDAIVRAKQLGILG